MSRSTQSLVLQVVRGIHTGASIGIAEGDVVIVGSGDDCDVVLSEPGIARHHCIFTVVAGHLQVRAVDSSVMVAGQILPPGDPTALELFEQVELASATAVAVGPAGHAAWPSEAEPVADYRPSAQPTPNHRPRNGAVLTWVVSLAAITVIGATIATVSRSEPPRVESPPPLTQLARVITDLDLAELVVSEQTPDSLLIEGIVLDKLEFNALRERVEDLKLTVDWRVQVGSQISGDVATILRAQGIGGATRYLGKGKVELRGDFGDQIRLGQALQSRAMQEIQGLTKVVVANTGPVLVPEQPDQVFDAEGKRVVTVVRGSDPHLVTADGSIYFVGAFLPGIGKFQGVSDDAIWFDLQGRLMRYELSLSWPATLVPTPAYETNPL